MLKATFNDIEFHVGDTVRVHSNVVEGAKTRVQIFEGMVIRLSGRGVNKTFTVRKISAGGIGVERIWPQNAKSIVKIEVKKSTKPRRSKLYYLRDLTGQAATRV